MPSLDISLNANRAWRRFHKPSCWTYGHTIYPIAQNKSTPYQNSQEGSKRFHTEGHGAYPSIGRIARLGVAKSDTAHVCARPLQSCPWRCQGSHSCSQTVPCRHHLEHSSLCLLRHWLAMAGKGIVVSLSLSLALYLLAVSDHQQAQKLRSCRQACHGNRPNDEALDRTVQKGKVHPATPSMGSKVMLLFVTVVGDEECSA